MAKIPFNMSKNEQYVECHRPFRLPNGKYSGMIRVYELLNPSKQNMLTTMDWSFEPVIVDPKAATGYNSLQIDGQFVDLEKLVQDLCKSRLRVNKLGYCCFQILRGVADTIDTYGFAFYRLNDKLRWSKYGVFIKLDNSDTRTGWDQCDILQGSTFDANEIHQKDNNNIANDQQKAQNQELMNRVKELEAQLDQQKAKNINLSNRVKELEAPVELNVPKLPSEYYATATLSPILFQIKRQRYHQLHYSTLLQHWESRPEVFFRTYTPTFAPVTTTGESYREFSITLQEEQGFDTSNWYLVGVKEKSTPILVYEGTMYSFDVTGHAMSSPVDRSACFSYCGPADLGPINLAGIGYRIGLRPWP